MSAQIKSAVKVNTEQLFFNWQLGRDLVERKAEEKWGKGIVEQLSLDLQNEFPKAKGFSARNLWNMKKWYLFYSGNENFSELAHHMEEGLDMKGLKLQQVGVELDQNEKLQQLVAEIGFPKFFGFVPWGHHIEIVTKCKTIEEALFYVRRLLQIVEKELCLLWMAWRMFVQIHRAIKTIDGKCFLKHCVRML